MLRNRLKSVLSRGAPNRAFLMMCALCASLCLSAQQAGKRSVSGAVTDESGEPVVGANVVEKGVIANGTSTNAEGKFNLNVSQGATLVVSYIGFVTQEVKVGSQSTLNIVLTEDSKALDEVVVVGYGTNSVRNLTASVSTIATEKMANLPVANITDALAGRTTGLIVTKSGGGLGNYSNISIRGGGTPIVVIDGFIVPYQDFQNLNSNDIESMSVLKDAASAAVYGARAGDGILVVKTKGGIKGKLNVDYSYSHHWSEPEYYPKKLNSYERAMFDNTLQETYHLDPRWTAEEVEKFRTGSDPFNYPNTDWQSVVLKDFAQESKHNVTMRGGSEINQFYVSFNAYDQQSLYRSNSHWLKRYNVVFNETTDIKSIGLKLNFSLNGYITNQRMPLSTNSANYGQTWGHISMLSPTSLAYNRFGQIYINAANAQNPVAETSMDSGYDKLNRNAITGLFNAEWDVYGVKGLKLKAGGNYRISAQNQKLWNKGADQYDKEGVKASSQVMSLDYNNADYQQFTLQYFADYKRSFLDGAHNVSATFGYEANYTFERYFSATRKEYVFAIDQMSSGPTDTMENTGREAESGRAGFIGRLAYDFKRKYYIEGSLRHDGSDLFPEGKRWGTFYAGSVGYAVSEESFFQPLKDRNILNFFKLRASYGETGLDSGVGRFSYLSSYGLTERGYVVDGKIVPTFSEGSLVSPDITWFTRNTSNVGFDFSSLNERLSGSAEYFYMKTVGYLASPSGVGYTDPLGKSLPSVISGGEHRRAGYEFALAWKDRAGELEYEVGGNFTWFDQLIAKAWNEDLSSQKNPYRRQVQQTGYYGIGYQNLGYYQNSDDVMNAPKRESSSNIVAGDLKYADTNGDGKIDNADERRIGSNNMPRGNYGIYASARWKGFFANILFQGATSRDISLDINGHMQYAHVFADQLDYWTPDNRDARYPRIVTNATINGNNNLYGTSSGLSDFWLVNGRYFRLKSAQIGYDFREKVLHNVKWVKKLNVVLSGQNLFTFSPAKRYGFDPEDGTPNMDGYPIQRVYSISVNVGF